MKNEILFNLAILLGMILAGAVGWAIIYPFESLFANVTNPIELFVLGGSLSAIQLVHMEFMERRPKKPIMGFVLLLIIAAEGHIIWATVGTPFANGKIMVAGQGLAFIIGLFLIAFRGKLAGKNLMLAKI